LFDEDGCADVLWLVLPGNHEIEPDEISGEPFVAYRRRWRTPEAAPEQVGKEARIISWPHYAFDVQYDYGSSFYSIRLGCAHLIILNPYTHADDNSPQIGWLSQELGRVDRSVTPYLLVFTHAPWHHSSRIHRSAAEVATAHLQISAERLLVEANVDMLFAGHVHAYERTEAIQGIRHVTLGHGGNRELLYNEWSIAPFSRFHAGDHYGWGELNMLSNTVRWRAYRSSDDKVVDSEDFEVELTQPKVYTIGTSRTQPQESDGHPWPLVIVLILAFVFMCCSAVYISQRHQDFCPKPRQINDERITFKTQPVSFGTPCTTNE